jgi:tetratricopeptide (TPR) repeat protein
MDAVDRERLLRKSVAIARETTDPPLLATALHSLAVGLIWSDQFAKALPVLDECMAITSKVPELAYLEPHLLSGLARALAGTGRLTESATAAERSLAMLAEQGLVEGELRLLRVHGDTLTKLGRTNDAVAAWRRFLALATRPEVVRESNAPGDDTEPSVTIGDVQAKLAALTG